MNRTKKGFTFIELLVSSAVVVLVGVAVYSTLSNGLAVWRRGNRDQTYYQRLRLETEKMAGELRSVFQFATMLFEGAEDSLQFAALVIQPAGSEEDEAQSYYQLGRIKYFFDQEENVLRRQALTYPEVYLEEDQQSPGEILIENLQEFSLSYCYLDNASGTYMWKADWKKEEQDSIPKAVKIKMVLQTGQTREEFEKAVFLALGTGAQRVEK
ncbi:type II secretion system protein GspJ [Candidatus Omnitrophota bacterium]